MELILAGRSLRLGIGGDLILEGERRVGSNVAGQR